MEFVYRILNLPHMIFDISTIRNAKTETKPSEISKMIAKHGKSLFETNGSEGTTAFHTHCLYGRLNIVHLLVARKVDINLRDVNGTTPLHGSCTNVSDASVTYFLLTRGADVNATDQLGQTPLHFACYYEKEDTVKHILDFNPLIDRQNHSLETALHIACSKQNHKICRMLVEKGADIYIQNNNSQNPLELLKSSEFAQEMRGLTSQLAADMKKVVNNKEYSDFQFLIEDKIIYAHKIILFARSKYFKDILEKTPEIASFKVEDFSYDVFMLVIEYIYTDHVKPLTSDLVDLSKAAAHFQLERLATLCGNSTSFKPSTLSADYLSVLNNPLFSDKTIIVEETSLHIHNVIVNTRCNYFKALITGGLVESTLKEIPLSDVSFPCFYGLLRWFYSDVLESENFTDYCIELLQLGDQYGVKYLVQQLESLIMKYLEVDTVCDIYALASSIPSCTFLPSYCVLFIVQHFNEAKKTKSYKELPANLQNQIQAELKRVHLA